MVFDDAERDLFAAHSLSLDLLPVEVATFHEPCQAPRAEAVAHHRLSYTHRRDVVSVDLLFR
jgi:hypothetical protein